MKSIKNLLIASLSVFMVLFTMITGSSITANENDLADEDIIEQNILTNKEDKVIDEASETISESETSYPKINVSPIVLTGGYTVSGDISNAFNSLYDALTAINSDTGSEYSIAISGNDTLSGTSGIINAGKNVTLKSDGSGTYSIFQDTNNRHFKIYGNLTLENIILIGNADLGVGGGIDIDGGSLTLNSGTIITKCYNNGSGGAIYAVNNSKIVMNEGKITNNKTSTSAAIGGGVSLTNSDFIMKNGEISYNLSTWGGGVDVGLESTFTMYDGSINDNETILTPSYGGGGGVHVYVHSIFTMNGGDITKNKSGYFGGGIYAAQSTHVGTEPEDWCKVIINGGNITENEAVFGGGIGAQFNGQIEMNSGTIANNKAYNGGGVAAGLALYEDSGVYFKMKDGEISNNEASANGGGVWIANQNNHLVEFVLGDSSENNTPHIYENTAANHGGGVMLDTNDDNITATIYSGEIYSNKASAFGGGICLLGSSTLFMHSGIIGGATSTYKNSAAVGGGIATTNSSGAGNTVQLKGGNISSNEASSTTIGGGGIYVGSHDTATITGTIHKNTSNNDGGGVYVSANGSLSIKNNSYITNNNALNDGGGIYTENYNDYENLILSDYQNLDIDNTVKFEGNRAVSSHLPPDISNQYNNIKFSKTSIIDNDGKYLHPINNFDINYKTLDSIEYYQIVYDANGGTGSHTTNAMVGNPTNVLSHVETGISRNGYTFVGWSLDGSDLLSYKGETSEFIGASAGKDEVITLYAIWKKEDAPEKPTLQKPSIAISSKENTLVKTGDSNTGANTIMLVTGLFLSGGCLVIQRKNRNR